MTHRPDPLAVYLAAKPEPHSGKTEADLIRAATAAGLRVAVEPARTGQTYRLWPKSRKHRIGGPAVFHKLTEAFGFALDTQRRQTAAAQARRTWR